MSGWTTLPSLIIDSFSIFGFLEVLPVNLIGGQIVEGRSGMTLNMACLSYIALKTQMTQFATLLGFIYQAIDLEYTVFLSVTETLGFPKQLKLI